MVDYLITLITTLLRLHQSTRDDHYPVFRLDIQQDSEFATGYFCFSPIPFYESFRFSQNQ